MQWFRMYAEFATDPVVQSMSFDDQRHFVIILCMKCSGALDREFGDPQTRIVMLRRALGLEALAFDEAKNRLCASGLINGDWHPKNWEKRQFVTDHSAAERMRKYRERHRDVTVTSRVTKSDVLDTESEAETDSEAEKNKKAADAAVVLHESLPRDTWDEWLAHRREKRLPMSPRALKTQLKLLARYDTETQRDIIEASINSSWSGLFAPKGKQPRPRAAATVDAAGVPIDWKRYTKDGKEPEWT